MFSSCFGTDFQYGPFSMEVRHPYGKFFAYSGVPHSIGVLMFFGDLSTPLVFFPHALALPIHIGVPMFLRNLCNPLVLFLNVLVCLMVSAY